jgi:hypothetical protein
MIVVVVVVVVVVVAVTVASQALPDYLNLEDYVEELHAKKKARIALIRQCYAELVPLCCVLVGEGC